MGKLFLKKLNIICFVTKWLCCF